MIKIKSKLCKASLLVALSIILGGCASSEPRKVGAMVSPNSTNVNAESTFKEISQTGFDGIQLGVAQKDFSKEVIAVEQIEKLNALKKKYNLEIASICLGTMNMVPFVEDKNAVEFVKKTIDVAKALDTKNILVPFFVKGNLRNKETGVIDEEKCNIVILKLKEIAPYAEKNNVDVCIETTLPADTQNKIIKAVNSKNIKVYFDTLNYEVLVADTLSGFKELGENIGQLHLKRKPNVPANFENCLAEIKKSPYKGWYVIELSGGKPNMSEIDQLKEEFFFYKNLGFFDK